MTEGMVGCRGSGMGDSGVGGGGENRLPMVIVTRVRAATGPYIILLSYIPNRGQQ